MRILQVVQKPQRRGAEVFANQLTQRLIKKGCEASIVYLYNYSGPGTLSLGSEDRMLNGRQDHILERFPGWHPHLIIKLSRVIRDFQPDVIQLNGARTVKYGALVRFFHPQKNWVVIYRNIGDPGQWIRGSLKRAFYRKFLMPNIDGIIAVSHAALESIRGFYNPAGPIVRIPTGFDETDVVPGGTRTRVREQLDCNPDTPVLIYVGSLTQEKRVDRLLRIVRKVAEHLPELRVWLIGDGSMRQQLEGQSHDQRIDKNVRFLGTREDIASLLTAADLFVLTSDTEGIPASILEAAFLEVPALATRVGSISECIRDGETGFLIPPQEEDLFVVHILRLLNGPAEKAMLGKQARKWVQENFSMDLIASKYLDFYQNVLSRIRNGTDRE